MATVAVELSSVSSTAMVPAAARLLKRTTLAITMGDDPLYVQVCAKAYWRVAGNVGAVELPWPQYARARPEAVCSVAAPPDVPLPHRPSAVRVTSAAAGVVASVERATHAASEAPGRINAAEPLAGVVPAAPVIGTAYH